MSKAAIKPACVINSLDANSQCAAPHVHAPNECGMCSDKENETEGAPGDVEDECDEVCIDFDPYTFIKNLPPLKHVVPRWRRSLLPRQTRQCKHKTLVSCSLKPCQALLHLSESSRSRLLPCQPPALNSMLVQLQGREGHMRLAHQAVEHAPID